MHLAEALLNLVNWGQKLRALTSESSHMARALLEGLIRLGLGQALETLQWNRDPILLNNLV